MIHLTVQLKRWLWYVSVIMVVFVLCWQNSTDSTTVTYTTMRTVQRISHVLGKDLAYSEKLYYIVRKTGHFLVFVSLAFIGHLAINSSADSLRAAIVCSFSMGFVIAVIAEFCQAYAFDREANTTDAIINITGTILGILVGIIYEWIKNYLASKKAETA